MQRRMCLFLPPLVTSAEALLLSPAKRAHCSNPALCSQPARACLKNFLNLLTAGGYISETGLIDI